MKKVYIIEILLMAVMTISLSTISGADNINVSNTTSITYTSDVDQDYGFYRVIDYTTHKSSQYVNNTLTINVGDTVVWINDATPDEPLTIISKEGLWGNRSAYLRWNYQRFSYIFNQSGSYEVYIREYPREQHQIIVVKGEDGTVTTTTPIPTVIFTEKPETSPTEIPTDTVAVKDTVANKKTQDLTVVWLLIIAAGLIISVAYELRKRKNK